MKAPVRLGLYVLGLAVVFLAALGISRLVGSSAGTGTSGHHDMGQMTSNPTSASKVLASATPAGPTVSQSGYTLKPKNTRLHDHGNPVFQFTIAGPDGATVTQFTPVRGADIHLVAVRHDMSGYLHVQPSQAADGTWSVPLRLPAPGSYRAFVQFMPTGSGKVVMLGVDLTAGGYFDPKALPTPERAVHVVGDLEVSVTGWLRPGQDNRISFTFSRGGKPVTDLQPYQDAYGQLVSLREGDLAVEVARPEPGGPGPETGYQVAVPSPGTYRLFLDFKYQGSVRTAAFTMVSQ